MAEIAAPTWFPGATRVLGESAGPFVGGGWKITHHTTEGSTAQGAIAAYRSHRGWPHFTAEWNGRRLRIFQHLPLELGGRALRNPPDGWETNLARTIQIEHVGFARNTGRWSEARYRAIGDLCRWIEGSTGVPRRRMPGVSFANPRRLSGRAFHAGARATTATSTCPGNDHTRPRARASASGWCSTPTTARTATSRAACRAPTCAPSSAPSTAARAAATGRTGA